MTDGGNTTRPTGASVADFLAAVDHPARRADALALDAIFREVTGWQGQMWGPSIVGYGSYHYRYDSGREGDMCRTGFSPRKAKHSIYLMGRYCDEETGLRCDELMERLGKHSTGASCLYVNKLADIDLDVLEQLVRLSWDAMNRRYPEG